MSGFIWTKEKEDVNNDKEIEEIIEEDEIFVIMRNDIPLGYYRCVSDINGDEIINIQDVISLIFIILGD